MNNALRSAHDYELYIYTLQERFPSVRRSTVILVRLGAALGRVSGELHFDLDFRMVVRERLLLDRQPVLIDGYHRTTGPQFKKLKR